MSKLAPVLAALAVPLAAQAQSPPRAEILILGSYHMANPGHDIHNLRADDVLAPARQQQLAELLDVLKRFHPTKIAIESDPDGQRPAQYQAYLAGTYTLTRNEIDQVGFRLAKELGLRAIYPVDADGDFPYERLVNWAKANGRGPQFDSLDARLQARAQAVNDYLQSHTVLQMLELVNADSTVAADMGVYFTWLPYGDRWDDAGADLLADWYRRNIHIYRNIVSLIESPNERILVLYGFGHLGWLRQDAASDPSVRLVRLSDLVGSH